MPRRPGRTLHDLRYRDFGAFVAGLRPKVFIKLYYINVVTNRIEIDIKKFYDPLHLYIHPAFD